ncbi:hypothetical protein G8770_03075 [Aestuariicella hydrocarbonica]|uniref:Uncharacterized protein n=1 Tax=Pseudomaricurvus hydrocarbonicus TaxID=1470433 RepID=A0A9E5JS54_9GAMM|nr:hypothetical protein [Aestuariicella hydrocarbonica]NHO64528.1 hypothetical protein [Aestuariicella hydrocarbonica]
MAAFGATLAELEESGSCWVSGVLSQAREGVAFSGLKGGVPAACRGISGE